MAFNFKTKKGFVLNTYTEQQDGYLMAERAKRDADGSFYLRRGKYTTCDAEHPDFYLALTRAKVRPGKDVVVLLILWFKMFHCRWLFPMVSFLSQRNIAVVL